jgi:hypothetical protein
MDDARAGLPETETVLKCGKEGEHKRDRPQKRAREWNDKADDVTYLGRCCRQEVVDLLVQANCPRKILHTADLSLDKMVAVDGGWDGGSVHASGHELEKRHLCGSILASNALKRAVSRCGWWYEIQLTSGRSLR